MKWFQLAQIMLPALGLVPGMAQVVPFIIQGVGDAQHLHGDTNNDAKRALVVDGAMAAQASGKVQLDPAIALAITNAVLQTIDNVHGIVKANQTHLDAAVAAVPTPAAVADQAAPSGSGEANMGTGSGASAAQAGS